MATTSGPRADQVLYADERDSGAASRSTLSTTPATPDSGGDAGRPTLSIEVPQDGCQHLAMLTAHTPIAVMRRMSMDASPTPRPAQGPRPCLTALHDAVLSGNLPALRTALAHPDVGAVLDLQLAEEGFPALIVASSQSWQSSALGCVRALLAAGARVHITDKSGYTALHWAAACQPDGRDIMQALVDAGAELNAPCKQGETPLHRAARVGRVTNVRWLLEAGADPALVNHEFLGAMDVAGVFEGTVSHLHRLCVRAALTASRPALRTLVLTHADCLAHQHAREHHQEAPERLTAIMEALGNSTCSVQAAEQASAAADAGGGAAGAGGGGRGRRGAKRPSDRSKSMVFTESDVEVVRDFPLATPEAVLRAHSRKYLDVLGRLSRHVGRHGQPVPFTPIIQRSMHGLSREEVKPAAACDTSFSPGSYRAALRAAGAVMAAVERVLAGTARNALCVVRPPGHHAGVNGLIQVPSDIAHHCTSSCGFCILNSVAIGALHALQGCPAHPVRRVAIVDLDVHHGNGTEDIVKHVMRTQPHLRSALLFASVHLYDVATAMKPEEGGGGASSSPSPPATRTADEAPPAPDAFPLAPVPASDASSTPVSTQEGGARRGRRRRRAKSFDGFAVGDLATGEAGDMPAQPSPKRLAVQDEEEEGGLPQAQGVSTPPPPSAAEPPSSAPPRPTLRIVTPKGTRTDAPPTPAADGELDLYSFYPGTGKDDLLPANIVNCALQPLWRAKEGPAPLPPPLLQAAETASRAAVALPSRAVAARALGSDIPHVYSREVSPTCTLSYGAGREAVRRAVSARLVPTLRSFGPDLILISAGFDGAKGDAGNTRNDGKATPGLNLRGEDFEWITQQIMAVSRVCCPGRVVSVLEGGYGEWKRSRVKVPKEDTLRAPHPAASPLTRALQSPTLTHSGPGGLRAGAFHSDANRTPAAHLKAAADALTNPPSALLTASTSGGGMLVGLAPFQGPAQPGTDSSSGAAAAPTDTAAPEAADTTTKLVTTLRRKPLAKNVVSHLKALVFG